MSGSAPCTHHEFHCKHAFVIGAEVERLRGWNAWPVLPPLDSRTSSALAWLKSDAAARDCVRFLMLMQDTLKEGQEHLDSVYPDIYWEALGAVLGAVFEREASKSGTTNPSSNDLLAEIADRFVEPPGEPWKTRRHLLQCLLAAARGCGKAAIASTSQDFEDAFWSMFAAILTCLRSSYEMPKASRPKDLAPAAEAFVVFCHEFVAGVPKFLGGNLRNGVSDLDGRLLHRVALKLAHASAEVLEMIRLGAGERGDVIEEWNTMVSRLIDSLPRPHNAEIQTEFGSIARRLKELAGAELSQARRRTYKRVLANLLPKLHERKQASPRKEPSGNCKRCVVWVQGQQKPIKGNLRNICASRGIGFVVEMPRLAIPRKYETHEDIRGEIDWGPDEKFYHRFVEGNISTTGGPTQYVKFEEITLRLKYGDNKTTTEISVPCKVLRAWPLERRAGTGIALLGSRTDADALPKPWIEYVESLLDAGRYMP